MHFTTTTTISVAILAFVSQNVFSQPVNSIKDVEYYGQGPIKISKRVLGPINDIAGGVFVYLGDATTGNPAKPIEDLRIVTDASTLKLFILDNVTDIKIPNEFGPANGFHSYFTVTQHAVVVT